MTWRSDQLPALGQLVRTILGISDKEIQRINHAEELFAIVSERLQKVSDDNLQNICFVITATKGADESENGT